MYSGKNKGSLATTPSGKISYSQTSETLSGTASTISLLQENNNVNKKIKKILTHTTNEAAKTFVKDVEALDKLAEMFSNAADNIKAKSEEVITNEQKNNTDKGVDIKYSISDDVIKKFEIENINDYVHVQKQVLSTLNAENFFDDEGGKSKTVINKDSGMVIVINKKGIKETFNNKNYFNYSRNLKLAKLASIRKNSRTY